MPPEWNLGESTGLVFVLSVCDFVCKSVAKKTLTLAITFEPLEIETSYLTNNFKWHQGRWPCAIDPDLWPMFLKALTIAITFVLLEIELSYFKTCTFLVIRSISDYLIMLKVLTLWHWPSTLTYISKHFNLCHNLWTLKVNGRAFIFHMYIPCDEAFTIMPKVLTKWLWLWPLTCRSKNFNVGDNLTVRDRNFIFGMYTQLMKPFKVTQRSMTLWPWPWPLTYISKNFNLSQIETSY